MVLRYYKYLSRVLPAYTQNLNATLSISHLSREVVAFDVRFYGRKEPEKKESVLQRSHLLDHACTYVWVSEGVCG